MRNIKNLLHIVLILLNITCLYLIIELSNYDEMISYLKNGGEKLANPRHTAVVFLFTCIINLLFVCIVWMKNLIFSPKSKTRIQS